MKGQPCVSAGYPEPYAATADTYDRLAQWAIEQWGESPRRHMVDFLERLWLGGSVPVAREAEPDSGVESPDHRSRGGAVAQVLEICCGTGLVLEQLVSRGYAATGLDRSRAMLDQARARLGDRIPLVQAELPDIPLRQEFDAVLCPAAALNYMPDADTLLKTFHSVAQVLRPGGWFVFDILSRRRLATEFAQTWAGDLGDLAFVWRFEHDPTGGHSDLTYTQFLSTGDGDPTGYAVTREWHRLHVLDRRMVRDAATAAGFTGITVLDNYSSRPAGDATQYETWTLTRS